MTAIKNVFATSKAPEALEERFRHDPDEHCLFLKVQLLVLTLTETQYKLNKCSLQSRLCTSVREHALAIVPPTRTTRYSWAKDISRQHEPLLATAPGGSKDPNIRASGPKYHSDYGIWALTPHYWSPWTLRVAYRCRPIHDYTRLRQNYALQARPTKPVMREQFLK